jgi:multidrug efflux pump subunit AcrB
VLSLVSGQTKTPDEIGNIVVNHARRRAHSHRRRRQVHPSVMPVYTIVTANAKPAVLLNVMRQPDSNTVVVADAIKNEIAQLRKTLPKSVELRPFYDQSELVTDSIKSVRDAILIGLILASLIMVLFLRDWGTSLVAGLVIPATIAVTFIALRIWARAST